MDPSSREKLAEILQFQTIAALATLRQSAPYVSMVTFASAPDLSTIYLHLSRLAYHTRDILDDPRVSLMINERDQGQRNPQTLARVSIMSSAQELGRDSAPYLRAKAIYLDKYPEAEMVFQLGDFSIFEIIPVKARYVAGFGQIFNLQHADFIQVV